jgi:hypothetical protein
MTPREQAAELQSRMKASVGVRPDQVIDELIKVVAVPA